jgi:hypothetical protein
MIPMAIRATADELLKEYKACESPDYISYVRAHLGPSLPCVTDIVRDPTMANRQVDAPISDVLADLPLYVLADIAAGCTCTCCL